MKLALDCGVDKLTNYVTLIRLRNALLITKLLLNVNLGNVYMHNSNGICRST